MRRGDGPGVCPEYAFSWKFTNPLNKMRLVAEKMSEHDYTERCNIDQKDEIGQLAQTLDGLGERLLEADQASKSWSSCAVILSRIFPMSCGRR